MIKANYSANNILLSIFKDDFKVQLNSYHYDNISIYCSFYNSDSNLLVDIDVYADYVPVGRSEKINSLYCSQFFTIAPIVTIAKGHVISDIENVIVSEVESVGD